MIFSLVTIVYNPHLFNHQTHHRGQVTAMLAETDAPYPVLDMHRILIPEPLLS